MTWDYAKKEYDNQAKADPVWQLERIINFGPNEGEKINGDLLKKYFTKLKIPDNRRDFLELLLWNKPF
ncbi:hypothetical protein HZC34_04400 [Candidatus Saganbacteria bacterium]|nr:hypothetical protein [Candidatus Saganbacteria bacterium]